MNDSQGTWSEIQVAGHACEVFEPAVANPQGYVAVYLHGVHLGRLSESAEFTAEFARLGLPVIGPRTARSWWTNRICAEFDPELTAERYLLERVVPYIEERWGAKPPRIAIFGTSMGGQGALRFAFKHPNVFPIAAAISPAIDYQQRFYDPEEETIPLMYADPEQARQDTATLHVHPLNWPRNTWFCCDPADDRWYDSAIRLHTKLSALGIPHDYELDLTSGGHGWAYYSQMAPRVAKFLWESLEKERRRVV